MRVDQVYLVSLLLLACMVIATHALAADCQSQSPNLRDSNNVWAPVSSQPLPRHLQDRVFGFFARLEGQWQGSGKSTACVMNGGNESVPVRAPEDLKLRVQRNGNAYQFDFSIYDKLNSVSTSYHFIVTSNDRHLQVTGEGDLALMQFYDGGIRFRTQTALRTGFRREFGKGSGNTVLSLETVRQFVLKNDGLQFYKAVFHNGAMIDYSHWQFSRD
ncbi:MAG: hypothetical protein P8047_05420 [Gammaproteobacteria bacterium]